MRESAAPAGSSTIVKADSIGLVATASLIGTTIEWYDFFLYGTAAALVFNRLYFPTFDPLAGTLAAFGTYTVGSSRDRSAASSSDITVTVSAASRCW